MHLAGGTFTKLLISEDLKKEIAEATAKDDNLIRKVADWIQYNKDITLNRLTANEMVIGDNKVLLQHDERGSCFSSLKFSFDKAYRFGCHQQCKGS